MSQEPIYTAKSSSGRIEIHENKVVIKNMLEEQIEIYIQNISGVEFFKGAMLLPGFMQIKSTGNTSTGLKQYLSRQNKVIFRYSQRNSFIKAKEVLEKIVSNLNLPKKPPSSINMSITEQLEKLSELKEKGVLTEKEFVEMKRKVIDG